MSSKIEINKFYSCAACTSCKFHDKHISRLPKPQANDVIIVLDTTKTDNISNSKSIGPYLHMDFGFVRGSDWSLKDNGGNLVTSTDKFRAYLLVIDNTTR